jgi:hypothetical protein
MTREEQTAQLCADLCGYFAFATEHFLEAHSRLTSAVGEFHGYRVRSKLSDKLILEVGGCDSIVDANDSLLQMLLVVLGDFAKKTGMPPTLDRKSWLRSSVISGGKEN